MYTNLHLDLMANFRFCFSILGRLLGSNEISFSSDGTNATFRVMFKEPIEIQHNTNYTASATLKVCDNLSIKLVKKLLYQKTIVQDLIFSHFISRA